MSLSLQLSTLFLLLYLDLPNYFFIIFINYFLLSIDTKNN